MTVTVMGEQLTFPPLVSREKFLLLFLIMSPKGHSQHEWILHMGCPFFSIIKWYMLY